MSRITKSVVAVMIACGTPVMAGCITLLPPGSINLCPPPPNPCFVG